MTQRLIADERGNLLLVDLPIDLMALPSQVEVLDRPWTRKTELHVTLVNGSHAEERTGRTRAELRRVLAHHTDDTSVAFAGTHGELRHVRRGDDETLVVMCDVDGLDGLYDRLAHDLGARLEHPPTHVTLYTRGEPIGIATDAALRDHSEVIEADALREALESALR